MFPWSLANRTGGTLIRPYVEVVQKEVYGTRTPPDKNNNTCEGLVIDILTIFWGVLKWAPEALQRSTQTFEVPNPRM